MAVPVALVVFNRPDVTRRTLAAIGQARPTQLFVIADGPRASHPADSAAIEQVREVISEVDWPCDVQTRFAEKNLGLEPNVELGLDWVFSQVDRAIVFEDDCVADPTFFTFCEELLDRYRDNPRVWQIAGSTQIPAARFGSDSYRFSSWGRVLGWATWSDRWHRHREWFPRDHSAGSWLDANEPPPRTRPAVPQPGSLVTRAARRHFAEAARSADGIVHGWDKHWYLSILTDGGLTAVPAVNMVEHIGFGDASTHGVSDRSHQEAEPMPFPLRHPATATLDVEVERDMELLLNRIGGPTARLARRVVRSPLLRRWLRTAADSAPAQRVARAWSRLTNR